MPFLFVPNLRGNSTNQTRASQLVVVKRHAALVSHRRKSRRRSSSQPGLGEETSSEGLVSNQFAQVEGAFDQQPTVPRGRAKSPKHGSRNPSADAGSAQNWDQDWDQDWDQENRLTQTESRPDEPRSLKIAEYVERTEMFAEAIELRNALAMVRSGVLTKPAYALTQTSTPSLHRAVEYCEYILV